MAKKLVTAFERASGFPEILDYNNPKTTIGPFTRWHLYQKPNGRRESFSTAFLSPDVLEVNGRGVNGRKLKLFSDSTALRVIFSNPVCFVTRNRRVNAAILGRRTTSPLVRYQLFSFESLDKSGRALCLGETALFQSQVNRLLTNLRNNGIKVTAVHNHWLFENPRLMYIHWESIDNPIEFAKKVKRSIAFLG